jgi:hypothetical protein
LKVMFTFIFDLPFTIPFLWSNRKHSPRIFYVSASLAFVGPSACIIRSTKRLQLDLLVNKMLNVRDSPTVIVPKSNF